MYQRLIKHFDTDGSTLLGTLSDGTTTSTVKDCSFELLRKGGCGSGQMTLTNPFTSRSIEPGDHIQCLYDASTPWYLGRVEDIEYTSPSEASIRMFGWWSYLNDVHVGGYGQHDVELPRRYSKSDWYVNDPDHSIQQGVTVSQPHQIINHIYTNYISPVTPITSGTVESPDVATEVNSFVFRGEENVAQIVRSLGMIQRDASYGVDASGDFFFINKNDSGSLKTYQEGVDLQDLKEDQSRDLMYNMILLTGGYVYGADTPSGFYRYVARVQHNASVSAYGSRKINLFVPWIRNNRDLLKFAQAFFDNYAGLTKRYHFKTVGQDTLYEPWDGQLRLLDASGTLLRQSTFDRIEVEFNEHPVFNITLGPEEPQFPQPPEPQRWEVESPSDPGDRPDLPQASLSIPGTWTSSSATYSYSSTPPGPTSCKSHIGGRGLGYYRNYNSVVRQVLGHDSFGCVKWYNIDSCS